MPSPGRVTSAAKSAPSSAARAGTDRICWKIRLVYPVSLSVRGRRALVVGGGAVAELKGRGLLDAHAEIVVVAPSLTPGLAAFAAAGTIRWEARGYTPGDLAGVWLAFAATGDEGTKAAVGNDPRAAGVLVQDASEPPPSAAISPRPRSTGPDR